MIFSEFDCFTIEGDFNIHIDNAEIKTTKEIITVLNTFDLIQHVHGSTHNRGHTLDLLISRGLNVLVDTCFACYLLHFPLAAQNVILTLYYCYTQLLLIL